MFSALRLEAAHSKEEILEGYLNSVSYGNQTTGAQAAARAYFGIPARDLSGRRKPVAARGGGWTLEAQCAIEAIGNLPDREARRLCPSVALDRRGLILADEKNCRTSMRGIFAGGDIIRGPDLVVRAVRDGKTAAASIIAYLDKKRGAAARRPAAAEEKI